MIDTIWRDALNARPRVKWLMDTLRIEIEPGFEFTPNDAAEFFDLDPFHGEVMLAAPAGTLSTARKHRQQIARNLATARLIADGTPGEPSEYRIREAGEAIHAYPIEWSAYREPARSTSTSRAPGQIVLATEVVTAPTDETANAATRRHPEYTLRAALAHAERQRLHEQGHVIDVQPGERGRVSAAAASSLIADESAGMFTSGKVPPLKVRGRHSAREEVLFVIDPVEVRALRNAVIGFDKTQVWVRNSASALSRAVWDMRVAADLAPAFDAVAHHPGTTRLFHTGYGARTAYLSPGEELRGHITRTVRGGIDAARILDAIPNGVTLNGDELPVMTQRLRNNLNAELARVIKLAKRFITPEESNTTTNLM